MDAILQGTTPGIEVDFSDEDFSVTDVTKLEYTIANGTAIDIHGLDEVIIDGEANTITYKFSEEETLALDPKARLDYQLRLWFADGGVIGTDEDYVMVKRLIAKGALE